MDKLISRSYTSHDLHFRESDAGTGSGNGIVSGKAICFNVPSNYLFLDDPFALEREVILPEAITKEFLDSQNILLTAYHNPELILGVSRNGQGTLKYDVREDGVYFDCQLPATQHGQEMRELIKRGDVSECSFVFTTPYFNPEYVEPKKERNEAGEQVTTFYVKKVTGVYDFTVCPFGAYSQTSCLAREAQELKDFIKRTAQSLNENPIKEDDTMTEQDINALAEKVADLIDERMRKRAEENEPKAESESEAPKDEPAAGNSGEPAGEPNNQDEPKAEPEKEDETREDEKEDEEKDRAYNQAMEMIKRSLETLA